MMSSPLVSVIVPNYNHERYLNQRLDSVRLQSYKDIEIILMDDASSDKSVELMRNYDKDDRFKLVIVNEVNSGSTFAQWMLGLQHAKGDLVWIAESDDYSDLAFLETLVPLFDNQQVAFAYVQSYDVDEGGKIFYNRIDYTSVFENNIWEKDFILDAHFFSQEYLIKKNVIPNVSAVLFRREELLRVLSMAIPFKAFRKCGDWLIYALICNQTDKKVAFVATHLNFFRHSIGNTRNKDAEPQRITRLAEEWTIRVVYKSAVGWMTQWSKDAQRILERDLYKLSKGVNRNFLKNKIKSLSKSGLASFQLFYFRESLRSLLGRK